MSKQLKAKILELELEIIALKSFNETLEHKVEELQSENSSLETQLWNANDWGEKTI